MSAHKKKYYLLAIPSSDDEGKFDNITSYNAANIFAKDKEIIQVHKEFDTKEQMDIWIDGYNAGIGYLGNGLYFTEYK